MCYTRATIKYYGLFTSIVSRFPIAGSAIKFTWEEAFEKKAAGFFGKGGAKKSTLFSVDDSRQRMHSLLLPHERICTRNPPGVHIAVSRRNRGTVLEVCRCAGTQPLVSVWRGLLLMSIDGCVCDPLFAVCWRIWMVAASDMAEFEKANVLFNLGAINAQMGKNADLKSTDGSKTAATTFQVQLGRAQ